MHCFISWYSSWHQEQNIQNVLKTKTHRTKKKATMRMHGPNQTLWSNKQIDSVVLCDCSVIGHRKFCSYLIFTSSVIFYWTDTLQYGIFLFNLYNNITKDKCYDVIYMPVLQYVMSENNARVSWFVLERPIDKSTCKLNGTESIFNLTRKVSDVSKQLVLLTPR